MSATFSKVIRLIGKALSARVEDGDLILEMLSSKHIFEEIDALDDHYTIRVYSGGIEIYGREDLASTSQIVLHVQRVQSAQHFIANSLDALISYQGGVYLSRPPGDWYLIREKYRKGDASGGSPQVDGYLRLPYLLEFMREAFDFSAHEGVVERMIILGGHRFDLPIAMNAPSLELCPSRELIESVRDDVLSRPQRKAKERLFKKAVEAQLSDVAENNRFTVFLHHFDRIVRSYEASRDNFISEFEFDKLKERFESRRHEFILKIDGICGDLLTKVLAVPIAQALVVGQYKADGPVILNVALLLGSLIFTIIGAFFVANQIHSLSELRKTVVAERNEVELKHPDLHRRISDTYSAVLSRAKWYGRIIPWSVAVLLIISFGMSVMAFGKYPPGNSIELEPPSALQK
ncbi:hypothetical protein [Stenotrophomonas lactitubi]|uniref:hypothetical protein n=1 Tax=Stenotrophomonas lactitubi TaxID=2045214 RepID=UPI0033414A3C